MGYERGYRYGRVMEGEMGAIGKLYNYFKRFRRCERKGKMKWEGGSKEWEGMEEIYEEMGDMES